MATPESLAEQFEAHRGHLRGVAYRLLGSVSDAEDAVQESWLRLSRARADEVTNLRGWLTTVVSRLCLDALRTRTARREDSLDVRMPDPIVSQLLATSDGPEADAIRADTAGLALLVVLDALEPDERVAVVLHDVAGLSFDEIAPIVDRTADATRQLASRARRRVHEHVPPPDAGLRTQRRLVDAFLAAARAGHVEGLLAVLAPSVVLRADGGVARGMSRIVRGADEVVAQAAAFSRIGLATDLALINDEVGLVSRLPDGRLFSVMAFAVRGERIVAIDILADADRLARLALPAVE